MLIKRTSLILVLLISLSGVFAAEPSISYKFSGSIKNDFYFNSRQNEQAQDGLFNILPKPVVLNQAGEDTNGASEIEMLSVYTRLGIDVSGNTVFGARSSGKIECDFGGAGSNYYLIRLRLAYMKLSWEKSELLIGQAWHPLFGSVFPTVPSANAGSAFQPFNRSPQIAWKQFFTKENSFIAAALYQMQYTSKGPVGSSPVYLKNSLLPDIYTGFERKTSHWISGAGLDIKTLKINHESLFSASAVLYSQYTDTKWQLKAKAIYGENLSDHLMIGGYGVCGKNAENNEAVYTNFNTLTSWINVVYGTKIQYGLYAAISQNLGTNQQLMPDVNALYTAYGYGFYADSQQIIDRMYRIAPHISYRLANFKIGIEYELTSADYGKLTNTGRAANIYSVNNHRAVASLSYDF